MNERELIELIESRLPEELTGEQIAELRDVMRTSPALRDALLDELRLEQGLATKYAPAVASLDAVVKAIAARAAARKRNHWLRLAVLIFAGVVLIGGTWFALHGPAGPPANKPSIAAVPADGVGAAGGTSAPASQAADASSSGTAVAAGDSAGTSTSAPAADANGATAGVAATADANAPAAALDAAPQPPWRTMEEPLPGRDVTWLKDFPRLLHPAAKPSYSLHSSCVQLRGRCRLAVNPAAGRLIRIAGYDFRSFAIECRSPAGGAVLACDRDGLLSGYALAGTDAKPLRRLVASDGRWALLESGPLDLRYQDGQLLVARADVPLLRLPLAQPPSETYLDVDGKLSLLQAIACSPLKMPQPDGRDWQALQPARLAWSTDDLRGARLQKGDDGSVELSAGAGKDDCAASAELSLSVGEEMTLAISGATPLAGFQVRGLNGSESPQLYLSDVGGELCALAGDPRNAKHSEIAIRDGLLVARTFHLRLAAMRDGFELSFGSDGNQWAPLWRSRLEADRDPARPPRLTLLLHAGAAPRSIRLAGVRLARSDSLSRLADGGLLKASNDIAAACDAKTWVLAEPALMAAKPKSASADAWRLACATNVSRRSAVPRLRAEAAAQALQLAALRGGDSPLVQAAGEELARTVSLETAGPAWQAMLDTWDGLALFSRQAPGGEGRLAALLDSWLNRVLPYARGTPQRSIPPLLGRLLIYDLLQRGQWADLRLQSARLQMLLCDGKGLPPLPAGRGVELARLADWAGGEARLRLGEKTADGAVAGDSLRHPLTIQIDRETMNVIAEFLASVKVKAHDHAARVLAQQVLPDALVATADDDDLYQSVRHRIRDVIESNDELAGELRRKYAPLAAVRLQRALHAGDVETLQSLAVQFHGTDVGDEATLRLADRELAMGNVFGAAAKYRMLLDRAADASKPLLAAKRRLAAALAGSVEGDAVRNPVVLPGGAIPAAAFEELVASLAKSRAPGRQAALAGADSGPGPAPGGVRLLPLCDIAADKYNRTTPFHRHVAWASDAGRRIILRQRERLAAVALDGRIEWATDIPLREAGDAPAWPAPPLLAGGKAYLRIDFRRSGALACFDLADGKCLWQQPLDEGVISEPVLINSWLYVLTCQRVPGNLVDIFLHRVSPETGESNFAARLVRLRHDRREMAPGRLVPCGELLVFRAAATLVCCDLMGEVRWVRRLAFILPETDPGLHQVPPPAEPLLAGGLAIVAGPGSPCVQGVRLDSGRVAWSYLQPDLRRLVGFAGGKLILLTSRHIEAVDPAAGKLLWRAPKDAADDAVIPAGKDSILTAVLEPIDSRKTDAPAVRRLRWLSAADGSVLHDAPIADAAFSGVERLAPAGAAAAGILVNYEPKTRSAKIVLVQVK